MTPNRLPEPHAINLDWLSWTMPIHEVLEDELEHAFYILQDVKQQYPELQINDNPKEFGRGVYKYAFDLEIGGKVFFKHGVSNYLIEVTGMGCHTLEQRGETEQVVTMVLPSCLNVTRIDVAVDYETDLEPSVFAALRGKRWKNTDHALSVTGDTFYVGAKGGDRQAKVYRYYPPHERSHLLRIEMTYRKKGGAWAALMMFLEKGGEVTAATMGKEFGWGHPLWQFESAEKIKGYHPETGAANTKRWIRSAVIPALTELYESGILDDNHPIWKELAENLPLEHAPALD